MLRSIHYMADAIFCNEIYNAAYSMTTERTLDSMARRAEDDLVQDAQRGDEQAFDELVRRHQDSLYRLMARVCCNVENAEEVAVDAFARAYVKLEQFEGRSSFVTWVGHIARNLCFRRREKMQVPTISLDEREGAGEILPAADASPEADALKAELRRIVHAAIDDLPEMDRRVLQLRDIEMLPAAEVSAQLGISVAAVKSRLHRARRALRVNLNGYFLDAG